MSNPSSDRPQKSRGRRGCCGSGCLLLFLLLLLIVGAGAALYLRLPQKLGLIKPATETLLADTPDREAASTILNDLAQAGLNTQGMQLYVLPYQDGSGAVVYAVLDGGQGFAFPQSSSDPVVAFLTELALGGAAKSYGVKRVAIDYRLTSDASLLKLTVSTQAIQDYAQGKIDRQKLLDAIEGSVEWSALAKGGLP
jgi:hypothetical protein